MDNAERIRAWNKEKWESKNQMMYEQSDENRWPWFNEELDPDIETYMQENNLRNLDILDLGTCSGSQAFELAKRGHNLVGTDISETALTKANAYQQKHPELNVQLLLDDISNSNLEENHFDMVLDRGCYHSICVFNHSRYVATIKRILRSGGILLLKTMSNADKRFQGTDVIDGYKIPMPCPFSEDLLRKNFEKHFDIVDIRESFFFSTVIKPPAQARFAILRNTK
jgi:cyclopropane fatty-acyl-phospholipid synthase-like methyltransferase